jgi:hypothetical protein
MGLKCVKCGCGLEPKKTVFDYMGMSFTYDVMCCPKCGAVLIPQDLAEGKMAEVERMMEDK